MDCERRITSRIASWLGVSWNIKWRNCLHKCSIWTSNVRTSMRRLLQASSYQVKKKNGVENFNEIQPIRRVFSAYRNGSFQTDPTFKTPITRTNRWSFGQNAKIERTKKTRITKEEGIRWEKNFCKAKILVQKRWSWEVVQIKVRESEKSIFRWTLKVTKTEPGKNVASIKRAIKEKRIIN